jgi:hypothetical protein
MDDTSVPRRTLLTDAQRAALLAIPTDETTLIRHYPGWLLSGFGVVGRRVRIEALGG